MGQWSLPDYRSHGLLLLWLGLLSLLAAGPLRAEDFTGFCQRLERTPAAWRAALVDSLLADLPGGAAPVIEDSSAHFVFHGEAKRLRLAGDMTAWAPTHELQRVDATQFWYLSLPLPADARLDYKLVRDDEWLLDPLNPRTLRGGFGPNSELVMPAYVPAPEVADHGIAAGARDTFADFYSPQLDNRRTLVVVKPPGYDPKLACPVLLVHDGLDYIELGSLERVLAYLAAREPELALPLCVCIPPVDRQEEYAGDRQQLFGRFVAETVVPFINDNYATQPADPSLWGQMGASNGGNISLYLLGTYPQLFGKAVVMSPYVSQAQHERIAALPPATCRIYLNWGRYDLPELIPLIEEFQIMLAERGVPHRWQRYNEGHSWGLWRATIDDGLRYLFGPEAEAGGD